MSKTRKYSLSKINPRYRLGSWAFNDEVSAYSADAKFKRNRRLLDCVLTIAAYVPVRFSYILSFILAFILGPFLSRRFNIIKANIWLCFPELSKRQKKRLAFRCGALHIFLFFQIARFWFRPRELMINTCIYLNLQKLDQQRQKDERGTLLILRHTVFGEISGILSGYFLFCSAAVRLHNDDFFNLYLNKKRLEHSLVHCVDRDNPRQIIELLRAGHVIALIADQDLGQRLSIFSDFFGQPTSTPYALTKLRKMGNAKTIFADFRMTSPGKYEIEVEDIALSPDFDIKKDVAIYNAWVERCTRAYPDQYYWSHRRFKTRPEGFPPIYQ